jgi:hypothetical protein
MSVHPPRTTAGRIPRCSGANRRWAVFAAAWAADVVWHRLSGIAADPAVAGFYTFDDFTMSVTPDLTLANMQALFNPANYDIIVRTLVMAIAVTLPAPFWRCRWPGIWRATPAASEGVFLYRRDAADVGELYRQSLRVDAAAGERWRGAVVSQPSGAGADSDLV